MDRGAKRTDVILTFGLVGLFLLTATAAAKQPGEGKTQAGIPLSSSVYVKMQDGVEIAISVYLPRDLKANERVPVLMRTTRYWREPQKSWMLKMLLGMHLVPSHLVVDPQVKCFNARRFAVLLVDARGSGASGGRRAMEYSPAEVADMGEIAAWAAAQPWSNAHVGTFGISYEGNTAELAAVPNQAAIRAVMPLYDTFDNTENEGERGVALKSLLREWSDVVAALDRDDVCGGLEVKGLRCWIVRRMIPGVRPVDGDTQEKHLKELLQQHHNPNYIDAINKMEFNDDTLTTDAGTFSLGDVSPSGLRAKIEASKVPMMTWEGWLDGGDSDGTLIRYQTFSNPQVAVIGPLSHGGEFNPDPRDRRAVQDGIRFLRPRATEWGAATDRVVDSVLHHGRRKMAHDQDLATGRNLAGASVLWRRPRSEPGRTFGNKRQRLLHCRFYGLHRQADPMAHRIWGRRCRVSRPCGSGQKAPHLHQCPTRGRRRDHGFTSRDPRNVINHQRRGPSRLP